jgi:uncharacterized protein (DUF2147 family)
MTFVRLPLMIAAFALAAPAAQAASVDGDWLTPMGGAKVHIAPCGAAVCGTIVWLKNPNDKTGQPRRDDHNPDPALKTRPVMGIQILHGLKPVAADRWTGGTIYNPGDGKTYDSKITLQPDGSLKVEGCFSIVCKAQGWTRPS